MAQRGLAAHRRPHGAPVGSRNFVARTRDEMAHWGRTGADGRRVSCSLLALLLAALSLVTCCLDSPHLPRDGARGQACPRASVRWGGAGLCGRRLSPLLAGRLRGGASGESSIDLEETSSVVSSDESRQLQF